jgi:ABC-type multidrug transport system fused ATPase/permease subunit
MLTVVVPERTAQAAAVLRRIAGYESLGAGVTWDERSLTDIGVPERRGHVMLLADDDYLFAGTLRDVLNSPDDATALAALRTACAEDVLTQLGGDLGGTIADRGRDLSGGQRQRLALARALAADPPVLLAVDPTSAVDATTESMITERLTVARRGRTTLELSASPLWLAQADHVVRIIGGRAEVERSGDSVTSHRSGGQQ